MAEAVSLQTTSRIRCIIGGEGAASIPAAPHPPDPQICSHTAVSGEAFTDCGTFQQFKYSIIFFYNSIFCDLQIKNVPVIIIFWGGQIGVSYNDLTILFHTYSQYYVKVLCKHIKMQSLYSSNKVESQYLVLQFLIFNTA